MAGAGKVKLHGMWASPFVRKVRVALECKGIPYDYVEEDLERKSPMLLEYNPVHKKVPILVHDGRPIAESLVILSYIDETWKTSPRLLPDDPHRRALVHFWADFIQQQLFENLRKVVKTQGAEQVKIIKQVRESLKLMEENMEDLIPRGNTCCFSKNLGLLEILMCTLPSIIEGIEEALHLKFIDPETNPQILSWITSLNELLVVKETAPDHDCLVKFFHHLRQMFVQI